MLLLLLLLNCLIDVVPQEVTTVGDCGDPDAMERALQGHTDLEEVMGLLQCVDVELEGLYDHLIDAHCNRPKLYPTGRLLYVPTEEFHCFNRNSQNTDSRNSEVNADSATSVARSSNDPGKSEGARRDPSSSPRGGGGGGGSGDVGGVGRGQEEGEEERWAEGRPSNEVSTSDDSGGFDVFDGRPRRVMVEAQQQHFSCLALHLHMYKAHLWGCYSEGVEALLHSSS